MGTEHTRPVQRYSATPFWVGFLAVFSLGGLLRYVPWRGNAELHTFTELVCIVLACVVGIRALLQYRRNPDSVLLILGTGFLGAALLDTFHLLFTSAFATALWPDAPVTLTEWSWTIARMFLGFIFLWSWLNWLYEYSNNRRANPALIVAIITTACGFFLFMAFYAVPPRAYAPFGFFNRPGEIWPGMLFALSAYGYLRKGHWRFSRFEQRLTLAAVLAFSGLVLSMSFSANEFDMDYQVAHLAKIASYVASLMAVLACANDWQLRQHPELESRLDEVRQKEGSNPVGLGLASKMAVLAAAVALLAGIPTGIVVYVTSHDEMMRQGRERLQIEARSTGEFLRSKLDGIRDDSQFVAEITSAAMRTTGPSGRSATLDTDIFASDSLIRSIQSVLRKNPAYISLSVVDAGATTEILRFTQTADRPVQLEQIGPLPDFIKENFRQAILHPSGSVSLSTIRLEGEENGMSWIPRPILIAVAPVYAGTTNPFAAIILHVDLGDTLTGISSVFEDTDASVADGEGNLIVHPDFSHPLTYTDESPRLLEDVFPALAQQLAGSDAAMAGTIEVSPTGEQTVVSGYRVAAAPDQPGPALYVIYSTPRTAIEAPAAVIGQKAQVASNIALGIAVILGWVWAQFMVRPVRIIADATRDFGRTGNVQTLPVDKRDEIGVLARAVDAMMTQIRDRQQDLEEEITERARAENAIAVAEARHRAVIESMGDAVIVADEHGVTQSFNSAAERMFGYRAEDVVGKSGSMLVPEDRRDYYIKTVERGEPVSGSDEISGDRTNDIYCRRKDGTVFPIAQRVERFRVNGKIYYSVIISDLSLQRQSELDLLRLAAAVDAAADSIVIMDSTGVIEYANPSYRKLTGMSEEQLIGKRPSDLMLGKDDASRYADIWGQLSSGKSWSGTFASQRGDGRICEDEVSISPVIASNGKITNFVSVIRDVTEQRALEQQLRQAQKLESIGQLAAGIAHEINTPTQYVGDNTRFLKDAFDDLNALIEKLSKMSPNKDGAQIAQALNAADVDYLSAEIPRAIEQSLDGIDRVSNIVRAMKEFSHPAQEKTLIDLNKAIQSTITVATTEWKYVADVVTDFDPDLPLVPCRPGDFNQVILNLIVNAAHAISDAMTSDTDTKGTIHVATTRSGDWVEIRISDTGTGMTTDVRDRIFDPFFTTKEVGRGTGQGLSMAHNVITERHGGTITVDSEIGRGSTFVIRIPMIDGAVAA